MSNKIPTFKELAEADGWCDGDQLGISQMAELSRKHTALHVQAALQAASEKVIANHQESWGQRTGEIEIDKESILNAYPLTNIV